MELVVEHGLVADELEEVALGRERIGEDAAGTTGKGLKKTSRQEGGGCMMSGPGLATESGQVIWQMSASKWADLWSRSA